MTTLATFRIQCPELSSVDDATVNHYLALTAARLEPSVWGVHYQQGLILLAAHLLTLRARTASAAAGATGAGPVSQIKTGELTVVWGAVAGVVGTDAQYATTPYGVEYLNLRRAIPTSPLVV